MTIQEIEARRAEIAVELETEGADLDALETEVRSLAEQEKEIREKAEADAEKRAAIAQGVAQKVDIIEEVQTEERKETMTIKELRSSENYVNAYADYLRTGKPEELRALLTEINEDSGSIPVPTYVEDKIRTAWTKNGLLDKITRSYVKGILKIGVEISGTGAVEHAEGDPNEVEEEVLQIALRQLTPTTLKKWISVSDEALDMKGSAFLDYIYDEITYKIAKGLEDAFVGNMIALNAQSGIPYAVVNGNIAKSTIISAIAGLSDEAGTPILIMNKATWAAFASLATTDGYPVPDPFAGLEVVFNNSLPAFDTASVGDVYALCVDPKGLQANFPNGDDIDIKFDDKTLMTKDLVRILGRLYVAYDIVAPYAVTQIKKVSEE